MTTTIAQLESRIRDIPLLVRLHTCAEMIGRMCDEGRCPKMSIPVQWSDEDLFITVTLQDAAAKINL